MSGAQYILVLGVDSSARIAYSNTDVYTSYPRPNVLTAALDRDSALPLYYQLKQWLVQRIASGALSPGDQIPTEQVLCEQFGLSRGTVRSALSELMAEGRLYLVRGRGTYVAQPTTQRWSLGTFVSISDALRQRGRSFECRVLDLLPVAAPPAAATALGLEPSNPVVYLKRLWMVEGEPLILGISYFPEKVAGGLYGVDLTNRSLYQALEKVCGLRVRRVDRALGVRLAEDSECALLNLTSPSAVHFLEDLAYTELEGPLETKPVEYTQMIIRGDKGRFEIQSVQIGQTP